MVKLERGRVLAVDRRRPGAAHLRVEVAGEPARALAYEDLTGRVEDGDDVVLNTTAVRLGLGTGGVHLVVAVLSRPPEERALAGHAMKLRYTPLQASVDAVEELHVAQVDAVASLEGLPVVVAGLHSALTPVAVAAHAVAPGVRVAYVMTDGAALHLGFSDTVPALREAGLLATSITAGQALGGDLEAVSLFGALAAAKAVAAADLVVVAMGPGNLGTGSRWGFALLETAGVINTVAAMGGDPIVVPRISFADPRSRHHGLSHHTTTALSMALARATVALPALAAERARAVRDALATAGIPERHDVVEVDLGAAEDALARSPVPLRSMGRSYADDPDFFRSAAAAGVLAARAARA